MVETGTGIAAGYAGKLFVDAGAEVVKVEPPAGDPLRRWSATGADTTGGSSPLFSHLAAGKRSVVGAVGDAHVEALLTAADLVIDTGGHDPDELRRDRPGLVVVSVTPFGRSGPLAGRPATDFTVQAECGSVAGRGVPERPPVQAGGRTSEWAAGLYGAVAGLAAVLGVQAGTAGRWSTRSWLEAMTLCANLYADPMWSIMTALMGIDPPGEPRSVETPSIYPTADGWIGFNTNGPQHAEAFLRLIERDDLIADGYVAAGTRMANRHEFDGWVRDWTSRLPTAEILDRAAALRVPTAQGERRGHGARRGAVGGARLLRGLARRTGQVPRAHYRIDGERPPLPAAAPALGADTASLVDRRDPAAAPALAPPDRTPSDRDPPARAGLKVLDITSWWAGPSNTQLLAALGADVVHVESIAHPDPMRYAAAVMFLDRDRWWELSSFYININTNKRGITLDLGTPDGVALAERLIGWADVVVENYTPRVMPKFGLAVGARPRAQPGGRSWCASPPSGSTGRGPSASASPRTWSRCAAWRSSPATPTRSRWCPAARATRSAGPTPPSPRSWPWPQRDRTGDGVLVEVPLIEGALNVTAEPVVEYTATGRIMGRDGNRSAHAAPQGLYAGAATRRRANTGSPSRPRPTTSGSRSPGCSATARSSTTPSWPTWPAAVATTTVSTRCWGGWAAGRTVGAAVEELLAAGVPAAALSDPRRIHLHPQLQARGFAEDTPHAVLGSLPVFGMPFRMSGRDRWNDRPAPVVGEHNVEVLGGLLGLDDDESAALATAGVIGDRPAGT